MFDLVWPTNCWYCCIATIQLYYAYTNIHGNIINCNDDFNKRTNTLLYRNLYLSHFIFESKCLLCVRDELKTGTDCYLSQVLLSTIAALLPHLGWVDQPWITEGRKALSLYAGSHAGILPPTDSNELGTWLYYFLTSTYFRCSSTYSHRCISWFTPRSRVNV